MIKYPSIVQYRNIVKDVTRHGSTPTIRFTGTVKVHGTNASVVIHPDGTMTPQSRNNTLDIHNDNAGFANWLEDHKQWFTDYRRYLENLGEAFEGDIVVIYGEFAGMGIQKGVAVSSVSKFFYVFGVKVMDYASSEDFWVRDRPLMEPDLSIIDATQIWTRQIDIDFTNPTLAQNGMIALTEEVENECPVGKFFGVSGTGEGVVWEHIDEKGVMISFKIKGEKHSISKVKTLAPVDVERLESIDAFVEYAVTENRLEQAVVEVLPITTDYDLGIDSSIRDFDRKYLGAFIKWVSSDINKEESDVLEENGLSMKDVGSKLSAKARTWFFAQELL
jgi:hypothetical protein|tara:strand:+ start:1876 stop:2874 length:999 start_codon:yes stop_codon:yes gene_type:complete